MPNLRTISTVASMPSLPALTNQLAFLLTYVTNLPIAWNLTAMFDFPSMRDLRTISILPSIPNLPTITNQLALHVQPTHHIQLSQHFQLALQDQLDLGYLVVRFSLSSKINYNILRATGL